MYNSYLVRVWSEEDKGDTADWQAEIQQIQSGRSWSFNSRQETMDCLQKLLKFSDDSDMGEENQK